MRLMTKSSLRLAFRHSDFVIVSSFVIVTTPVAANTEIPIRPVLPMAPVQGGCSAAVRSNLGSAVRLAEESCPVLARWQAHLVVALLEAERMRCR